MASCYVDILNSESLSTLSLLFSILNTFIMLALSPALVNPGFSDVLDTLSVSSY